MPERQEAVSIHIDGRKWSSWSDLEIRRSIDEFSTVGFTAPFEPERPIFRDTFQPFSFKTLVVRIDDEVAFSGTLINIDPTVDAQSRSVRVSAYSFPGVLADCTPPVTAFPLELNGLKLRRIAETLVDPFGLDVVVEGDDGAVFRRVKAEPDQAIHGFLVDLAQQRGMVLSDTPEGALLIHRSRGPGQPVARLAEGDAGLISVTPTFAPQAYFSELTGLAKTRSGRIGAKYTVQNDHLPRERRPHIFRLEDTDGPDVPAATRAKLGRMFGNALTLQIQLPTWRTAAGELFEPNTTLILKAPGAMIYRETEFLIRSMTAKKYASTQDVTLDLVLPGAFSGEIPSELPWA